MDKKYKIAIRIVISTLIIMIISFIILIIKEASAHDMYNTWQIPNSKESCCSNKDCKLTKAYWDGKQWMAWYKNKYVPIPNSLIINTDKLKNYDGNAHLCAVEIDVSGLGERGVTLFVFCFAPPEAKF